jgi:hypothetical protein
MLFGIPTKTWTLIVMAITITAIATWDTLVAVNTVKGDTISEVILTWHLEHPLAGMLFILAVGILLGHLYWPQRAP